MLRRLLHAPFPIFLSPETLTLIYPYSTRCRPKERRNPAAPPHLDQPKLELAISQLPPRFTPSDLTHLLSRISDPHLCFHLLNWAQHHPRFRPDPDLFHLAIKKLGAARLFPQLHSLSSLALASLPPSLPLFNTIIYFFAEARMLSKAIHVYNLMRDSPDPASRPNAATYKLLFNALLGRGPNSYINHVYMDTVRCLFRQMVNSGVAPDLTSLNFLVRGYVLSLHLNDALRVFHQFGPVYGVEPDANTYSYLVHGLCAQGRTKNALELYGEMKGKGMVPSLRAGNSLVSALAMGGEVDESVRVLWEVVGRGRGMEVITCRTVVEGMWRERGPEAVTRLVRELREREVVDGRVGRQLMNWVDDGCGCGQWNE